jgi:hypothetical protein
MKKPVGVMSRVGTSSSSETIRLEEYTGVLQNKLIAVWQAADAVTPWLPTEFMLSQYITRILVTGRVSPVSTILASDPSWTQVWRSPGGKEWACLLGILAHMPVPMLIVVGPDMALTPKLVSSLKAVGATVIVLRTAGSAAGWAGDPPDQMFLPVLSAASQSQSQALTTVLNEWMGRTAPRGLDPKILLPQLAAQGYGLTAADGVWFWYKPADSAPLVALTVPQIARQLQILGAALERSVV